MIEKKNFTSTVSQSFVATFGLFCWGFQIALFNLGNALESHSNETSVAEDTISNESSALFLGATLGFILIESQLSKYSPRVLVQTSSIMICIGSTLRMYNITIVQGFTTFIQGIGFGMEFQISPIYLSQILPASKYTLSSGIGTLIGGLGLLSGYLAFVIIQHSPVDPKHYGFLFSGISELLNVIRFLIGLFFLTDPVSWLIQSGNSEKAPCILKKLYGYRNLQLEMTLQNLEINLEKKKFLHSPTFLSLFSRIYITPWILCTILVLIQVLTGDAILQTCTSNIFLNSGFNQTQTIILTIFLSVISTVSAIISIKLMPSLRRKQILLGAMGALGLVLTIFSFTQAMKTYSITFLAYTIIIISEMFLGPFILIFIAETLPEKAYVLLKIMRYGLSSLLIILFRRSQMTVANSYLVGVIVLCLFGGTLLFYYGQETLHKIKSDTITNFSGIENRILKFSKYNPDNEIEMVLRRDLLLLPIFQEYQWRVFNNESFRTQFFPQLKILPPDPQNMKHPPIRPIPQSLPEIIDFIQETKDPRSPKNESIRLLSLSSCRGDNKTSEALPKTRLKMRRRKSFHEINFHTHQGENLSEPIEIPTLPDEAETSVNTHTPKFYNSSQQI